MCGKVILSLAILAFISVQLAHSLKCQTCSGPDLCKTPTTMQCDAANANATAYLLSQNYFDVQVFNSNDFSCIVSRYKERNNTVIDIRGCIMTGSVDCNFNSDQRLTKDKCDVCKKDNCNKSNSVGTYSSSIVTMISLFVLAKTFVI